MIIFKISFILAFSLKPKLEVKKKQKGKSTGISGKLQNGNRNNKKKQKNKKDEMEVISNNPKYKFEMDKLVGVAHIEYELIPNKIKYQIDIKCWGPIAKVNIRFHNLEKIYLKTSLFTDIH